MKIAVFAILIVASLAVFPAYGTIVEFGTEKMSYKQGDNIVFVGKTDAAHANKIISVKVYGPDGSFVILREQYSDQDGNFKSLPITASSTSKFQTKGVYNATAFYSTEPNYPGKFTLFDYSADGSLVSPSAADLMGGNTQTTPPPAQQPTPQPTPPPAQEPTPPPPQPTTTEPKCGAGTVLKDGVCVVAAEPEPEENKPKATHIPGFPDPTKDPQSYVDRYNNEPAYKEWFDRNFPDDTIYEIVGLPDPNKKTIITTHIPGFPDPTKDPQSYVDRYNNEPAYKEWFDRNFPDMTIYQVLQIDEPQPEPEPPICGEGTHLEGGLCVLDEKEGLGGCLIATAAYGTELAPQVQRLREIRDGVLLQTESGSAFLGGFNALYYSFSPAVSDLERQSPLFRGAVQVALTPMLSTLSILGHVEIDSEQQMLGYGIGLILLNTAMYLVAPAFAVVWAGKLLQKQD